MNLISNKNQKECQPYYYADAGGLAAWVNVLESGREDRAKVLEGFSDSAEFAEILASFGLN